MLGKCSAIEPPFLVFVLCTRVSVHACLYVEARGGHGVCIPAIPLYSSDTGSLTDPEAHCLSSRLAGPQASAILLSLPLAPQR